MTSIHKSNIVWHCCFFFFSQYPAIEGHLLRKLNEEIKISGVWTATGCKSSCNIFQVFDLISILFLITCTFSKWHLNLEERCMLPHKAKTQYVHFWSHTKYFLLPLKIPDQCSAPPYQKKYLLYEHTTV